MIVFSLTIFAPEDRRADILDSLAALLEPTRVEVGCVACHLYIDSEDPNAITLVEEWASQSALDRHLASDACKTLVAAMELSVRAPPIRFDRVAERAGIEVIEAARLDRGSSLT